MDAVEIFLYSYLGDILINPLVLTIATVAVLPV